MKKYIFMVLMAGLLIGCSNPADQKQPATKSEQPAATQETTKPAAPPAPAVAPETKTATPAPETKIAVETQAPAAAPAASGEAVKEAPPAPAVAPETKPAEPAPVAPHTSDVTSDKPVAGAGVTETVKTPAGQEAPKTGQ
ncbi:MAG: hypothetical protein ABWK15_04360 [Dissulfuribacterales bacterium]